jgi:hypothetical protein
MNVFLCYFSNTYNVLSAYMIHNPFVQSLLLGLSTMQLWTLVVGHWYFIEFMDVWIVVHARLFCVLHDFKANIFFFARMLYIHLVNTALSIWTRRFQCLIFCWWLKLFFWIILMIWNWEYRRYLIFIDCDAVYCSCFRVFTIANNYCQLPAYDYCCYTTANSCFLCMTISHFQLIFLFFTKDNCIC